MLVPHAPVNHVLCIEERPLATLILCLRKLGVLPHDMINLIALYCVQLVHMREIVYEGYPIKNKLIINKIKIKYKLHDQDNIHEQKVNYIERIKRNTPRSRSKVYGFVLHTKASDICYLSRETNMEKIMSIDSLTIRHEESISEDYLDGVYMRGGIIFAD